MASFPPLVQSSSGRRSAEPEADRIVGALDPLLDSRPTLHKTFRERVPKVSIILPFHNESAVAANTAAGVLACAERNPHYHFVLIDDGSTDATPAILRDATAQADPGAVELIECRKNQGKGRTIKSALPHCTGDYVCFMDGDLAYSLDHIDAICTALIDHDVVIGSRVLSGDRGAGSLRTLYSNAFNYFVRKTLGLPFRDTQAGLKGFRRETAVALFSRQRIGGFGFDAELLFIAKKLGCRIAEAPAKVDSHHSYKGSIQRLVIQGARAAREILEIRRNDRLGLYA